MPESEENEKDLRELLKRGDWEKVIEIVRKDPEKFDELLNLLKDAEPTIRSNVAVSLGHLKDPRAIDSLIEALKDLDSSVRWSAAFALSLVGDASAVDKLIQTLQDEDHLVRLFSASALGHIGDIKAVEPLINALNDGNYAVRREAVTALGEIGDERAIPAIQELLETETNEDVRERAYDALQSLRASKIGEEVESTKEIVKDIQPDTVLPRETYDKLTASIETLTDEINAIKSLPKRLEERFSDTYMDYLKEKSIPALKDTVGVYFFQLQNDLLKELITIRNAMTHLDTRIGAIQSAQSSSSEPPLTRILIEALVIFSAIFFGAAVTSYLGLFGPAINSAVLGTLFLAVAIAYLYREKSKKVTRE